MVIGSRTSDGCEPTVDEDIASIRSVLQVAEEIAAIEEGSGRAVKKVVRGRVR